MSGEAMVLPLGDLRPQIAEDAWLAPGVVVVGDVRIEAGANLWFGTVARGDIESLTIGAGSNVQDGCVLHADPGQPLLIGAEVTIGHRAIVHGCHIADGALIGMGATVMNGVEIGEGAMVGAGAIVTAGTLVPERTLAIGVPAKVIRSLDEDAGRLAAGRYRERALRYRDSGIGH